jgi:small subunit ribosomal protein S7
MYKSVLVHIIVNRLIRHGKKSLSAKVLYSVLDKLKSKVQRDPLAVLEHAIRVVTPTVQLSARRLGGTTYQIPIEVGPRRGTTLAIQWVIKSACVRQNRGLVACLSEEILDVSFGNGGAVRKREEVHRIAKANKAFARYRFLIVPLL